MKVAYPTIFTPTKDCYLVEVPDLDILTQGTDLENAIEMARDAISVTIVSLEDAKEAVPAPTPITAVDVGKGTFADDGKGFVSVVDADISDYRRKIDTKPVRRNVSLPSWLNYEVNEAGINVSRFLQDALVEKLNIQPRA